MDPCMFEKKSLIIQVHNGENLKKTTNIFYEAFSVLLCYLLNCWSIDALFSSMPSGFVCEP